jgi:hypothetical protein
MFQNTFTLGMVGVDITEIRNEHLFQRPSLRDLSREVYFLSCSLESLNPCRRTVFELERVEKWSGERDPSNNGDPVRYAYNSFQMKHAMPL